MKKIETPKILALTMRDNIYSSSSCINICIQ